MTEQNKIVLYRPDETLSLDVRVAEDTVWLNRQQMAELFGRDVKTIGKHINNALKEELAVGANFATVQLRESTCSILERDEVGKDFLRTDNTNTYKLLFTVLLLKHITL